MNKNLFNGAFFLGAMAVVWVGAGYVGTNFLALAMTMVIAAVYAFGALELHRFRQATASLAAALEAIPVALASLDDWLGRIHPSLQNAVRLRIEGERGGLPGPALTPYLVGLLVMLGMLGTFLGMVVTLNGAVFALEGTTDLQAIRAALAAPIKGLGLAFGTSVAGVAASAMLGLMSALCRRERMLAAHGLDGRIAKELRAFSLSHQRQEAYRALRFQAQALPAVVDKLQALMVQMDGMGQQLNQRLLSNQESFHGEVKDVYTALAGSVDKSLRESLAQSAQAAGESLKPVVEAAMSGMAREAGLQHERLIAVTQTQLDGIAERFGATATTVAATWTAALATHERTSAGMVGDLGRSLEGFATTFAQRSSAMLAEFQAANATLQAEQQLADQQRLAAATQTMEAMATALQREWQQAGAQTLAQQQAICATLGQTAQELGAQAQAHASGTLGEITRLTTCAEDLMRSRIAAEADWMTQHNDRMDQLAVQWRSQLAALRDDEAQRGDAAVARLGELQTALAAHLSTLGTALEAPITRLIETAAEAPRAAAAVISQLRQEITNSTARDNELLEERRRIMETLNTLLAAINHAAAEQRSVIDTLVVASAQALDKAGGEFAEQLGAETARLAGIAAEVTGSAVEVASLGEAFGLAVQAFSAANEKLVGNLQGIEAALDKSMARSDEQLAYYVAQAREIIDLSMLSQKEIFAELQQVANKQALLADEVA